MCMNREIFSAKWQQVKGKVKEKWGKLNDEDLNRISGKFDQLSAKLQEKYGWHKEKADQEIANWCESCNHECKSCASKECKCAQHEKGCNCCSHKKKAS